MKGTTPRGLDLEEDAVAALRLQHDEKNRSEHVMIVDLLRNDLGRICTMGSVHVEDLFTVEHYETLLQMTSTVSGTLKPGLTFYEIFRALFPSGSITGAPKIRTMQIIRNLEAHPRDIYTGAIGHIAPNRNATFNVAIRTLTLDRGAARDGRRRRLSSLTPTPPPSTASASLKPPSSPAPPMTSSSLKPSSGTT